MTLLKYSVLAIAVFLAACSRIATLARTNARTTDGAYVTCNAPQPSDLFPPPPNLTEPRATLWFINTAPRYSGVNLCVDSWQGWPDQPNSTGYSSWFMRASSIPHTLVATATGDSAVLASTQVTLAVDTQYTVLFTQRSTKGGLIVLLDTVSAPPPGEASFRLVNAAPDVGAVDVYMTTGSTDLTGLTPVVSNLAFEGVSPYVSYPAGLPYHHIIMTAAGHPSTVLCDGGNVTDVAGQVYTILLMYADSAPALRTMGLKDRSEPTSPTSTDSDSTPTAGTPQIPNAPYQAIDLGTLGGPSSQARSINDAGEIVGTSETADGSRHAFRWANGVMTDLGTLGGSYSWAESNNSAGQVVGESFTSAGVRHATLWMNGRVVDLGTLGGRSSQAMDINPAGQIVGLSETANGETHAFLWENGVMTDLGTLGGSFSQALGINPRGDIVGDAKNALGEPRAFVWSKGVMKDLGPLQAFAINPAGDVVGTGNPVGALGQHPVLWRDGAMIDLGTLGGDYGFASAISPTGAVVGWSGLRSRVPTAHAFIWASGAIADLGTLGGARSFANGINAAGKVVGSSLTASEADHATLWVPK